MVLQDHGVQVVSKWAGKLVEEVEDAPDANAVAVVAPGVVALRLRHRATGRVGALPRAEGEVLYVVAEVDGEPFVVGPRVVLAAVDRDVVVAVVGGQLHGARLQSSRGGDNCSIATERSPLHSRRFWSTGSGDLPCAP